MGEPKWYYRWIKRSPGHKIIKSTFKFCGIKPIRTTEFGSIKKSSLDKRKKWLEKIRKKGQKLL